MPDVGEYLNGYKLQEGRVFGGYKISKLIVSHKSIVRWNEYSYPTDITFTWNGPQKPTQVDMSALFEQFTNYISGMRIIRTRSGRPYQCLFQWPIDKPSEATYSPDYTQINIHYNGHAKRVSEAVAAQT